MSNGNITTVSGTVVTVQIFKPTGKWYTTLDVLWLEPDRVHDSRDALLMSIAAYGRGRELFPGMTAVAIPKNTRLIVPAMVVLPGGDDTNG